MRPWYVLIGALMTLGCVLWYASPEVTWLTLDGRKEFDLESRCVPPQPINMSQHAALLESRFPCCGPSQQDLAHLLARFAVGMPFTYVHFNDGEIIAASSTDGVTDRGMQANSPMLKERMRAALRVDIEGAYFGAPCSTYFNHARVHGYNQLAGGLTHTKTTVATLLIDGNYLIARPIVTEILKARQNRVRMVVANEANMTRFVETTGITPATVWRVPGREAFPTGYESLKSNYQQLRSGDIVLIMAGPLGRILAAEWFVQRPCVTILELGSFFDLDLFGKSFGAGYYDDSFNAPGCENSADRRAEGINATEILSLMNNV